MNDSATSRPLRRLFLPGRVMATPGARALLKPHGGLLARLLYRHTRGDWGALPDEDKAANEAALVTGARLLSAYDVPERDASGEVASATGRLWIITEAGNGPRRPYTTFLLPDEY